MIFFVEMESLWPPTTWSYVPLGCHECWMSVLPFLIHFSGMFIHCFHIPLCPIHISCCKNHVLTKSKSSAGQTLNWGTSLYEFIAVASLPQWHGWATRGRHNSIHRDANSFYWQYLPCKYSVCPVDVSLLQHSWCDWSAHHHALLNPDDKPFTRSVAAEKHVQHAGQGPQDQVKTLFVMKPCMITALCGRMLLSADQSWCCITLKQSAGDESAKLCGV